MGERAQLQLAFCMAADLEASGAAGVAPFQILGRFSELLCRASRAITWAWRLSFKASA